MIMRAWRVTKAIHAHDAFSGNGAANDGGRWNSTGTLVVYTAHSISLACLEVLVGGIKIDLLRRSFVVIPVDFDSSLAATISSLPKAWNEYPPAPATQRIGDEWVKNGNSAVLMVPSAVIMGEFNYLINPTHADFSKLSIGSPEKLTFDQRLVALLNPPVGKA